MSSETSKAKIILWLFMKIFEIFYLFVLWSSFYITIWVLWVLYIIWSEYFIESENKCEKVEQTDDEEQQI